MSWPHTADPCAENSNEWRKSDFDLANEATPLPTSLRLFARGSVFSLSLACVRVRGAHVEQAVLTHIPATMGRMHTPGKGISSSALPYIRSAPSWVKNNFSAEEVVDLIVKLAKKGLSPSKIGACA